MNTFYAWLTQSSVNPDETSLAVRGTLLGFSSYALLIANVLHVSVNIGQYTNAVDTIATLLGLALTVYHSAAALYGFGRKIYTTFKGTNLVLNPLANQPAAQPVDMANTN